MNEIEKELLASLDALQKAASAMPTANPKPDLKPLFERLDSLTLRLPKGTDPNLLHYLHHKSYQKARLFLAGRESENAKGTCRHG
jgi:hypothetical protein